MFDLDVNGWSIVARTLIVYAALLLGNLAGKIPVGAANAGRPARVGQPPAAFTRTG